MSFVSWPFAVFLPVVFVLHYLGRSQGWQVGVLTLSSFVFYGWSHPRLIPLLALACWVNSAASWALFRSGRSDQERRRVLLWALAFNLGTLGFFKYAALIGRMVLPESLWGVVGPTLTSIPLPVGISFFTFQGISLVVDAWHAGSKGIPGLPGEDRGGGVGRHYGNVTFFKAFFPQLVAGPIVKAGEFFYQISAKRLVDIPWDASVKTLILGFFFKMVVADNLKEVTAAIRYPEFLDLPSINLLALVYAFSFQLLADFAGYSLIAIGLARLFGYEFPANFNHPYLSRSITEFWRRWHMTLSSWLREYLYIPLGGNRRGEWRTHRNLFLVMFLGGLWHGAAWSYAVWGTAHGVLLALERLTGRHRATESTSWSILSILQAFLCFTAVTFLWLLFQLPEFGQAVLYLRTMATQGGAPQVQALYVIACFSLPVILWHLWGATEPWRRTWSAQTAERVTIGLHGVMLFLIITNSGPPGEFIYFQF